MCPSNMYKIKKQYENILISFDIVSYFILFGGGWGARGAAPPVNASFGSAGPVRAVRAMEEDEDACYEGQTLTQCTPFCNIVAKCTGMALKRIWWISVCYRTNCELTQACRHRRPASVFEFKLVGLLWVGGAKIGPTSPE